MRSRFDHDSRGNVWRLRAPGFGGAALGLLLAVVPVTVLSRPTPAEETILLQLWERHQSDTTDHARLAALCARIETRYPDTVFLPLIRGLAAWHHAQDHRTDEAMAIWQRIHDEASRDPIGRAAQRMARTWLTRIDREQVRAALRKIYAQNVRYPQTLDPLRALDGAARPPLQDRWGDPWRYEWARFRFLNVREGQHYRLESPNIRTTSDLREALQIKYGDGLTLRPERVLGSTENRQTLQFTTTDTPPESVTLTEGASYQGQSLVYVGRTIVILADSDHWGIFDRPGP